VSYLSASKLTFSPKWAGMSDDERLVEQVSAVEIVGRFGGEIKSQHVLWSDGALLSITEYPDELSSFKAQLAIARRGAFVLESQRAIPLDDLMSWQEEVNAAAGG
jgi:hypothetical protein